MNHPKRRRALRRRFVVFERLYKGEPIELQYVVSMKSPRARATPWGAVYRFGQGPRGGRFIFEMARTRREAMKKMYARVMIYRRALHEQTGMR